ncbi:MAG: GNAT family N-acetyltransferase [Bacteroidales bacterium]|nr:GNAT family N-acetyltransferase [Bacteroidales bacterium]
MKVEKAQVSDAAEILEVQKRAFHQEAVLHNKFDIPALLQDHKSIQDDFNNYSFYKLCSEGKIVASVKVRLLEGNILSIGRLVVLPEYQRKGLGRTIMEFLEASYSGVTCFELFTAEKSVHNIRFYEQLGYHIEGRLDDPAHDDIVLVKLVKDNRKG